MDDLTQAITKRRAFAIISHPDAGKTTLTEKLLLHRNKLKSWPSDGFKASKIDCHKVG